MNPIGICLTLVFVGWVFCLSRPAAALGILAAVCYITQGQMIIVGGFHLTAIRIVLLAALVRTLARGEFQTLKLNRIDKAVLLYSITSALIFIARQGSIEGLVGQIGISYNILFAYFVFRCLLTNYEEVQSFLGGAAILIIPLALFLALESQTGANMFYMFGGVPSGDEFRDGHYRCQATFRSPITVGTLGATLMPLFVGMWLGSLRRGLAVVGLVGATIIVMCSRSSGPLLAYGAAVFGLLFWLVRDSMKVARRGFVVTIIALHLYMKAPVWFLMGRISDLVGGGGWHRAEIVDAAVNYFGNWWLWGTNNTSNWVGTQLSFGGADLTNQFVAEGVNAGLISMIFFIWIIVRGFKDLGLSMKKVYGDSPKTTKLLWALGAALFGTVVNFFSVSYFDQIDVIWWALMAIIATLTDEILQRPDNVEEESAAEEMPQDTLKQPTYGYAFASAVSQ
jgi:hypothetical protein